MKLKASVRVNQSELNRLKKDIVNTVDKDLWVAMEKVQNKARKTYIQNVGNYKRLPKFFKTTRHKLQTGNVQLNLEVSAAEGKRRGADISHAVGGTRTGGKRQDSVKAWDDIAYQIEYGTTKKGSTKIHRRSQLMSIPIHADAIGKSPRDFPAGKWINANGKLFFVTILRGGSFHKPVPARKAKGQFRFTSKVRRPKNLNRLHIPDNTKYKFLFVGEQSVYVKSSKPYWTPTLTTMFGSDGKSGEMIKILKDELGQDFTLVKK